MEGWCLILRWELGGFSCLHIQLVNKDDLSKVLVGGLQLGESVQWVWTIFGRNKFNRGGNLIKINLRLHLYILLHFVKVKILI